MWSSIIRMAGNSNRKWQLLQDLCIAVAAPLAMYFALQHYLSTKESQKGEKVSRRLEGILDARDIEEDEEDDDDDGYPDPSKRSRPRKRREPRRLTLTTYEQSIASEVVQPSDIPVSFADVGGLDNLISDLQESVIYPLTMPQMYQSTSSLLSAPTGVLLYGPPGCGKTMLAKALAHESGAVFINLHISTLTEKWYGDSNKLVSATFSLARKLAPAIIFIDEIDALLGTRRSGEHEASGMVKAEFMTHWDGLASAQAGSRSPQRIMILGATNRYQDIDDAILRRMPKRFAVALPDADQRKRIFKLFLKDTKIDMSADENGNKRHLDLDALAEVSEGMSGSDIKEMCREAAMAPVRAYIQQRKARGHSIKGMRLDDVRGLRTEDFFHRGPLHSARTVAKEQDGQDEYATTDEESGDEYASPQQREAEAVE